MSAMAEGGEPARAIHLLRSLSTPESSLSRLAGEGAEADGSDRWQCRSASGAALLPVAPEAQPEQPAGEHQDQGAEFKKIGIVGL